MIIREANLNDIDNGLLNVFIEGYRFHQNGRPDVFSNLSDDSLKKDLIDNLSKFTILILLDKEEIVGYLAYNIKEKHSKKIHIDQLIVTEKSRGHGYGKLLMNELIKIGKENNCERVELDCWTFNENALAMYEHIGFKKQRIMYEYDL
ncbi:MAG: GNAT family N-acetyltransferase [Bacilli bacterium]|nr:GNAT family N-acetyltransferase [Bacilli bacterium]